MSGGHFDYKQYCLHDISSEIRHMLEGNRYGFRPDTLAAFSETADMLEKAGMMVHRIDWLVSGDDSEETFHQMWKEIV